MSTDVQHLSIIHIISSEHAPLLNELAELLGYGADNLSIQLQDESGNIYYGCHSWWLIEKYIMFKDHMNLSMMGIDMSRYKSALLELREFFVDTKNMTYEEIEKIPFTNWHNALSEMGLAEVDLNIEENLS